MNQNNQSKEQFQIQLPSLQISPEGKFSAHYLSKISQESTLKGQIVAQIDDENDVSIFQLSNIYFVVFRSSYRKKLSVPRESNGILKYS
jgi:hypothetical protein